MNKIMLLIAAASLAVPLVAAPRKATLICRMGGAMNASVAWQIDHVKTTLDGKEQLIPVTKSAFAQLTFGRSKVPVSPNGADLQPGFCGWTDRAMTTSEPSRVIEKIDDLFIQSNVQYGNGSTVGAATVLSGGHLNHQNKQVFSMIVMRDVEGDYALRVVEGTTPKPIK
jgi:hypothetical protein